MRHSNSSAFTLAEILVIMVIIAIIALWSSTLNFNKMSQKQQLDIEMQKIVNIIEETRNNALLGKSIGNTNQAPTFWRVDISASGSTESLYSTDGINYTSYLKSQILHPLVAIRDLRCDRVDMTPGDAPFLSGSILFSTADDSISLIGCDTGLQNADKVFHIEMHSGGFDREINFNTVTQVIGWK